MQKKEYRSNRIGRAEKQSKSFKLSWTCQHFQSPQITIFLPICQLSFTSLASHTSFRSKISIKMEGKLFGIVVLFSLLGFSSCCSVKSTTYTTEGEKNENFVKWKFKVSRFGLIHIFRSTCALKPGWLHLRLHPQLQKWNQNHFTLCWSEWSNFTCSPLERQRVPILVDWGKDQERKSRGENLRWGTLRCMEKAATSWRDSISNSIGHNHSQIQPRIRKPLLRQLRDARTLRLVLRFIHCFPEQN